MSAAQDTDALQGRVVELETRLAFQEHAMAELSDALAELRTEAARSADLLRRVLEEVKLHRGDLMADPAEEPPPPHY
ncbi:MAG: SlyX family protein [Xanthomonadales bacterium]|jgi:SlyX protein|nr:SlyX family protein [Xanthomonadales bacterium]